MQMKLSICDVTDWEWRQSIARADLHVSGWSVAVRRDDWDTDWEVWLCLDSPRTGTVTTPKSDTTGEVNITVVSHEQHEWQLASRLSTTPETATERLWFELFCNPLLCQPDLTETLINLTVVYLECQNTRRPGVDSLLCYRDLMVT